MNSEGFMRRCLQLAALGAGHVAPNPMVGSVLTHSGSIIGEGYHEVYGGPHAEVNAIREAEERFGPEILREATLYVSLEPCAHHGKTPPCADLIVSKGIPRVVVGIRDPFPQVNGKGIERLRISGVEVTVPVLENECRELNRRFFTVHTLERPYVILKWARSADGFMGKEGERVRLSGGLADVLVHRWRSEESSILVGARTALVDDPALTTRHWPGPHPLRIVLNPGVVLPAGLKVLDEQAPTLMHTDRDLNGLMHDLQRRSIQSVLVEGGARVLQSFLAAGLWDEIRVITARTTYLVNGIPAPALPQARFHEEMVLGDDVVTTYFPG